jgi:transposase
MGHVEGVSRDQRQLLAASLDEMIGSDHPVRVIDAFVGALDLEGLGFGKVVAEATGRPPYDPGDLLKLYLYGYLNQVRSSRRLAREAERNVEVHWLINRVTPSFKTIAAFRQVHPQALVGVCRTFVQFCRGEALYGGEMVAIDGTKVEAVASRRKVITPKSLDKQLAAIDRKISEHLEAMDVADRTEVEEAPLDVAAALAALGEQKERITAQAAAWAKEGIAQQVMGEPDARLMYTARHGHQVAYNAQLAVDAKNGLIAAFDLTNDGNDLGQLYPMASAAKEALEVDKLTVVADTGYSNGEQGKACRDDEITAVVPRPQVVNPNGAELFSRDAFAYDPQRDCYTCPAGATLTLRSTSNTKQKWRYETNVCAGCALRPQCTKAEKRSILRDFHEADREAMHTRAMADPAAMKRRRVLAEHPFGCIKAMMGHPKFVVRGLEKAKAELALIVLGFNIKRAITLLGVASLIASLKANPLAAA